jgi:hypothetical protein
VSIIHDLHIIWVFLLQHYRVPVREPGRAALYYFCTIPTEFRKAEIPVGVRRPWLTLVVFMV